MLALEEVMIEGKALENQATVISFKCVNNDDNKITRFFTILLG